MYMNRYDFCGRTSRVKKIRGIKKINLEEGTNKMNIKHHSGPSTPEMSVICFVLSRGAKLTR